MLKCPHQQTLNPALKLTLAPMQRAFCQVYAACYNHDCRAFDLCFWLIKVSIVKQKIAQSVPECVDAAIMPNSNAHRNHKQGYGAFDVLGASICICRDIKHTFRWHPSIRCCASA